MKGLRIGKVALVLFAALLLVAAPVAAGGRVIRYQGYHPADCAEDLDPMEQVRELPGGRLLLYDPHSIVCSVFEVEGGAANDYVSGLWDITDEWIIVEPSGAMVIWGKVASLDMDKWPGDDGDNGWSGTFKGVISANGNYALIATYEGRGALEGWRMTSWDTAKKGGDVTVRGTMFPPK